MQLQRDIKLRHRQTRIRPFDLSSRIAFVARLGSNDRDICARHLFILPQEGFIRDTHSPSNTWNRSLVRSKAHLFLLRRRRVTGKVLPSVVYKLKYPGAEESVGFLIQESYFSILTLSRSEESDIRVSSRDQFCWSIYIKIYLNIHIWK